MNLIFKISIILTVAALTISLPPSAPSFDAITLSLNNRRQAIIRGLKSNGLKTYAHITPFSESQHLRVNLEWKKAHDERRVPAAA